MKKMTFLALLSVFSFFKPFNAQAELCTVSIQRVCQQNQPCRNSDTRSQMFNSLGDCLRFAQSQCQIFLKEAVVQKQVQATYANQPINNGTNLCK